MYLEGNERYDDNISNSNIWFSKFILFLVAQTLISDYSHDNFNLTAGVLISSESG